MCVLGVYICTCLGARAHVCLLCAHMCGCILMSVCTDECQLPTRGGFLDCALSIEEQQVPCLRHLGAVGKGPSLRGCQLASPFPPRQGYGNLWSSFGYQEAAVWDQLPNGAVVQSAG